MAVDSSVSICNLAADHLKESAISSIESPTTLMEVTFARWYDHVRKAVLRKHPWNFAIERASLAKLSEAPSFQYTKQFQLPSDFIRLLSVGTYGTKKNYQLEGGKILTDDVINLTSSGALNIRYIKDFSNVSQMDALFIDVFAVELAIRVSYQVTGSNTKGRELMTYLKMIAPEAYAVDGQERPPIRRQTSKLSRARRGNVSNSSYASPYTTTEDY